MCTATWVDTENGYILGFNRDEQRSRSEALPPKKTQWQHTDILRPTDPKAGGTWIAVNQFGATICILNYYQATSVDTPSEDYKSRGSLIVELSHTAHIEQLQTSMQKLNVRNYRGFHLLFKPLQCKNAIYSFLFDGHQLIFETLKESCITSSSFDGNRIISHRKSLHRQLLQQQTYTNTAMREFHRQRDSSEPARGVCMSRSDAKTVSYTEVAVNTATKQARMSYLVDLDQQQKRQNNYLELC